MKELLEQYANDPSNDVVNYRIGLWYSDIEQYASALSFLLRAAELTESKELAYECLVINALNFRKMGERNNSQKNQLMHAISLMPDRPEAYFLLSRFYEETKQWHESYMFADIGAKKFFDSPPNEKLDFPGTYGLVYQKAISGWWICKFRESRKLFEHLLSQNIREDYKQSCVHNLQIMDSKSK